MKFSNVIKRTSICLGLLLITTIINNNYQYAVADSTKNETKTESDKKDKNKKEKTKSIQKKASKAEIEAIKSMYEEFQKLVSEGKVTDKDVQPFYEKHFDTKIYKVFGFKYDQKKEFDDALIKYFANLLSSDLIQKTKGYELSNDFSKLEKRKTSIIKCKLKKNEANNETNIEMSVILTKGKKVKDLAIMQSFNLVKGAKNIVENYCKEKKNKEYKTIKAKDKLKICKEAWGID